MSYKLADGSMSTDYKIGDKFALESDPSRTFVFTEEDDTAYPWFRAAGDDYGLAMYWGDLTPLKAKSHASVINQLKETIRQLKATIQELER
jgi:hypothetical protein